MQRAISKAAIQAGKKNNVGLFFENIAQLMKHRDLHGAQLSHFDKIKEICNNFKERTDLTGMQLCYLALLYCHFFVEMDDAYSLMAKAIAKDPSNDIIKREKLIMQYYDGQQEEAEKDFQTLKPQMKDQAIISEITTYFAQQKKMNAALQSIFELFGTEQWEKANSLVDQNLKELGGVNPYNLNLYRMKMDILRALKKMKELGQFYDNLAKQAPNQNGYYQYAGDVYLEIGMKNEAIKSYANYYLNEYQDMEALTKYLELIDKDTQIKTLKHLLDSKIAQPYQKQEIADKLNELGVQINVNANDSDEEEQVQRNNKVVAENQQYLQQWQENQQSSTEKKEVPFQSHEQQKVSQEQTQVHQEQKKESHVIHVQSEQKQIHSEVAQVQQQQQFNNEQSQQQYQQQQYQQQQYEQQQYQQQQEQQQQLQQQQQYQQQQQQQQQLYQQQQQQQQQQNEQQQQQQYQQQNNEQQQQQGQGQAPKQIETVEVSKESACCTIF